MKVLKIALVLLASSILMIGCGGKKVTGEYIKGQDEVTLKVQNPLEKKGLCVVKAKFKCDGKLTGDMKVEKFTVEAGKEASLSIKSTCTKAKEWKYNSTWGCAADAYPEGNVPEPKFK